MAVRKSINFLPEIFRSKTNNKFVSATMDQLISEPDFRKINGYIGRQVAPTFVSGDSYIPEPTAERQNYQLEASMVVEDANKNVAFFNSYTDLLQKIAYYGGLVNDHSRLFAGESYNFNGLIDFDKFVNFNQYYWLPDGPPEVAVSASSDVQVLDYKVNYNRVANGYNFTGFGTDSNPILTLVKGTTYTFSISQAGHPFWIQTQLGATGTRSTESEALSRDILGIDNNGIDAGLITFRVPNTNAQDAYISAEKVADVDLATTLTFAQLQNHLNSNLVRAGGIDGVTESLRDRTLIFLNPSDNNEDWTDPGVFDFRPFDSEDAPVYIPQENRQDIFRISTFDTGGGRFVIQLVPIRQVNVGQKVFVKAGKANSGVTFFKNSRQKWEPVRPITATLDTLYYQDGVDGKYSGIIRLVEPDFAQLDVETDIIGKPVYTSPNGVKFTNGLKIRFDSTVVPAIYSNGLYIVEGVGRSITLVPVGNLIIPEEYVNPLVTTPDYVTINRASSDLNAWSRSNRWFHTDLLTLTAKYNNDTTILEQFADTRARRPIIEFEADIMLFNHGSRAKAPVDIIDYTVTDAFSQVEGKTEFIVRLPNGVTRQLTSGTRIIFANDLDPDVRNRIWQVDFISTSQQTQIHLVSKNTQTAPSYYVSGATMVQDTQVAVIGGNPIYPATATANIDPITGTVTNIIIGNTGAGYRGTPTIVFVNKGKGIGANAVAHLTGTGYVGQIELISGGTNYATAPTYATVPTVTFTSPFPGIGTRTAQGVALAAPTSVNLIDVNFSGLNYIAEPTVTISTTYDTPAVITPVYNAFKYVDYIRITDKGAGYSAQNIDVIFSSPNPAQANTFVSAFANGLVTSDTITLDAVPSGLAQNWFVYAPNILSGTKVSAVNGISGNITLSIPVRLFGADEAKPGPNANTLTVPLTFKSNVGNVSIVSETVRYQTQIKVDTTQYTMRNMILVGGSTPVPIQNIFLYTTSAVVLPITITTSPGNPHGFVNGDLVTIIGVNGTTQLNNNSYYVDVVDTLTINLYSDVGLTDPVDGRSYFEYVSGGYTSGYTVPYDTRVIRIIDSTTLQLSKSVSLKQGTELVFLGVPAKGSANGDGSGIYTVIINDPGSGYTSAPSLTIPPPPSNPEILTAQATATAILNNNTIEYFTIQSVGSGYRLGTDIITTVINNVEVATGEASAYGSRVLTFDSYTDVQYIKPGWLAFLVVPNATGGFYYADFSRTPYVETEVTGPNPDTYQFYMDVDLSNANILKVLAVADNQVVLTGDIDARDADGEPIDLPAGSKVVFSAQNRFFTQEQFASSQPIGSDKTSYIVNQVLLGKNATETGLRLNTVMGIQAGMSVTDLAGSLPDNLRVTSVDQYSSIVYVNSVITLGQNIPLKFSTSAVVTTKLAPSKIVGIDITDPGAEYTSAPRITITPQIPAVTKFTDCAGGTVLIVPDHDGIEIGATVTSNYNANGIGLTTGADVPKVVDLQTVQLSATEKQYRVILDIAQEPFVTIEATFTYAAKAIAEITSATNFIASDGDTTPDTYEAGDTILLTEPTAGSTATAQLKTGVITLFNQYYYTGQEWIPGQQKNNYNQSPLFDIFDKDGNSVGDSNYYPGSKFAGTKVYSYKVGTGANDKFLGFPLSYRSFQNVGDIQFNNDFDIDTFRYNLDTVEVSRNVNNYFLKTRVNGTFAFRNIWTKLEEKTKQYQIIHHEFDGRTNYFEIDILPLPSAAIPYIKVYVDHSKISSDQYTLRKYGGRYAVVVDQALLKVKPASNVDIFIYAKAKSNMGYYEIPSNIDVNAQNSNFTVLTLGQMRNHFTHMSENHLGLSGTVAGKNNSRDLYIKDWQGSIVQHASPGTYAAIMLGDSATSSLEANSSATSSNISKGLGFVEAAEYAQKEYTRFKQRFLDQCLKQDLPSNIADAFEVVMTSVMVGKNSTSPWYDSDMVPWGGAVVNTPIKIINTQRRRYEIPNIYKDMELSRRSILVYLRDDSIGLNQQLIKGIDFEFNQTLPAIDLADHVQLTYTQTLLVVERPSTIGSYVPETPTKLGLYPRYVPTMFEDTTYQVPVMVIQGHDGSLTPVFNDIRDRLLMELELRIYNNIKVDYQANILDIYDYLPGKFRNTEYTLAEFNRLLTRNFLNWVGNNQLNYTRNDTFAANNSWSWNYHYLKDADGEFLPGFWRAVYQHYYDTDRPNTAPWEMLGFSEQPTWWTEVYGPAPYTGANKLLWDDLEAGRIARGTRAGVDTRFARPGLNKYIPVDDIGLLLSPEKLVVSNFDGTRTGASWSIGDQGPVETAWRRSSAFPYAVQIALALAKPAFYFGSMFNTNNYYRDRDIDQLLLTTTKQRVTQTSFDIPSDGIGINETTTFTAGYVNWIRDYLVSKGLPASQTLRNYITNFKLKLGYKMAGFADSKFLTILADQSSPSSNSSSVVIPQENYKIFLNKGTPLNRLIYSAVIIEKSAGRYTVTGYDTITPYFTIIPSSSNNNAYKISELNETAVVYRDFQRTRITVPYGYEFTTRQEIVDFLVSYGRFLIGQGFVFDEYNIDLTIKQDWVLSAREFLVWSQQGWKAGNVLVLSPAFNAIKVTNKNGVVDHVENVLNGSKVLDQNFTIIKNNQFTVTREDNTFTLESIFGQTFGLVDLNLVQYEHVVVFDNTTVFNDVIYVPELGSRQYRLKLIGNKTGSWTGQLNPAGFIYNNDKVDIWQVGTQYRRGSLVNFKDNYYYASVEVNAAAEFDFSKWTPIEKSRIKTGLLPNFALNAQKFNNIYDLDNHPADSTLDQFSQGLVGYRARNYFQDFDLDQTSQVKFYHGFIKQKGTLSSVTTLTRGNFNNLGSNISLYEEWGFRVGDYGALGSDQAIEIVLDESTFVNDPTAVVLLARGETPVNNAVNVTPETVYRFTEDTYNPQIVRARTDVTPRISDNLTAGYPRLDDVDYTVYDISDFASYYQLVEQIGAGYKLWVAKDFNKDWNVYRATETDITITEIRIGVADTIQISFDLPHGLEVNNLFVLKSFDPDFNGFYRVTTVTDQFTVIVPGYRNLQRLRKQQTIEGKGIFFVMDSVRYNQVSDITKFTPIHGWRENDRVWVDNDISNGVWAVFEKSSQWNFNQLMPIRDGDFSSGERYGASARISVDNRLYVAGTPGYSQGTISGLRVLNPGSGYGPLTKVFISTPDVAGGYAPVTNVRISSGTLINAQLTAIGLNYQLQPNITIVDGTTHTLISNTLLSDVMTFGNVANVYVGDSISLTAGQYGYSNIFVSDGITVQQIFSNNNKVRVSGTLSANTGIAVNFTRGTGGIINARLSPTNVTFIDVIDGGSGFTSVPSVEIIGGGGSGATAGAVTISSGTITAIAVATGGAGYTEPPIVNLITTNPTPVILRSRLSPVPIKDLIVSQPGQSYKEPKLLIQAYSGDTGVGATGTVGVTDNSIASVTIYPLLPGTGYAKAPVATVYDPDGTGSGAVLETIFTTGAVKAFTRPGAVGTLDLEAINTLRPFSVDAIEFGHAVDIGYTYTFASAPGSFTARGAVQVSEYFKTNWLNKQVLSPVDLEPNARFGESLACSRDEKWLYVGAPGANKVYVYARKSPGTGQLKINIDAERRVYSYVTNFVDVTNPAVLKVVGTSGRVFLAAFDYSISGGILTFIPPTGSVDPFDAIEGEVAVYVTRQAQPTTIIPLKDANDLYQTIYPLVQRPNGVETISVVGSSGRLYVPSREFTVIGSTIIFLTQEFINEASITVSPLDPYYVEAAVLEPDDRITWKTKDELKALYDDASVITLVQTIHDLEAQTRSINNTYTTYSEMVDANLANGTLAKVMNYVAELGTYSQYEIYIYLADQYIVIGTENLLVSRISKFGQAVACTNLGYQVVVGAPEVSIDTGIEQPSGGTVIAKAGKSYVFDRAYQVYTGTGSGQTLFTTSLALGVVNRVTLDDFEVREGIDYTASGFTVRFFEAPKSGQRIKIDINKFNLIQNIPSVDPVYQGFFGKSVAMAPDNQGIFIGAPGYRDVNYYNGRVYRFVNQGLFYGSTLTTQLYPVTTLGDTIRINDVDVLLSGSIDTATGNGSSLKVLNDISAQNIIGVTSSVEGISGIEFNNRGAGYFSTNVAITVAPPDLITGTQALVGNIQIFGGNGAIKSYDIIENGSGYTSLPKVTITGARTTQASAIAINDGSPLRIEVTSTQAIKRLDILPGVGTGLKDTGIKVYALTQVIEHPRLDQPEKFGYVIRCDGQTGETLVISSDGAATLASVTFDAKGTIFDRDTTRFIDSLKNSGAVYVYDYLPVPGETLQNPGKFLFNQVLQNSKIKFNDNFGSSVDINNGRIMVGAFNSSYYSTQAGLMHLFINPTSKKGWSKLRSRSELVDIDYINKVSAYNKKTQVALSTFDYYDPAKGKILGIADQDIDYKTSYDPAFYNKGTDTTVNIDATSYWNDVQIGRVWWNLDACRYITYEQGELTYRISQWGGLFPGSTIEILEWVESQYLPSDYVANGGDGVPKYPNDSAYVEVAYIDTQSGLVKTKYYYWVTDKVSVDTAKTKRINSISAISDIIQNPIKQELPYIAALSTNTFAVYNSKPFISGKDSILRIEYAQVLNNNIAHSEYELVQQGNPLSAIPTKLINKLIDSLAGENLTGDVVPDLKLREVDRLGISLRPRQSMLKDQAAGTRVLVQFVNKFFKQYLIAKEYDLTQLKLAEAIPQENLGFYDSRVTTKDALAYFTPADLFDGFRVLVETDADYSGFWTIYFYTAKDKTFTLERIQSYDSTRYWNYANWYINDTFNDNIQVNHIINSYNDIETLKEKVVDGDILKVTNFGGNFELYQLAVDSAGIITPTLVGAENGTIQLNSSLYDNTKSLVGFDNPGFDTTGFSKSLAIEARNIINGIFNYIFIGDNRVQLNKVFFALVNYILSEQQNADWLFKTSFITVVQKIRKLEQFASYIKDQQDYYQSYINEVKPYRTQLRDYLLDYEGLDESYNAIADFDFPAYYDPVRGTTRSLNPTKATDLAIVNAGVWKNWYQNYRYSIQRIVVTDSGSGYKQRPLVRISGGGGVSASARAVLDTDGKVVSVTITSPGQYFTSAPTITFVGGGGSGAKAYAELVSLTGNTTVDNSSKTVRTITTILNFDRITYSSSVRTWKPYTTYHVGDIVVVPDVKTSVFYNLPDQAVPSFSTPYRVLKTILGTVTLDLNIFQNDAVVQKLSGSDVDNAVDRLAAFHKPGTPDVAVLFNSPDTVRLTPASNNNDASSTGNQWARTAFSGVIPAANEYQYISVGQRGLLSYSQDGVNWTNVPLNDQAVNLRDVVYYNGTTWVAIGNRGYVLTSLDAVNWNIDQIITFRYSPSLDAVNGLVLNEAAQAVDLTGVTAFTSTQGSYILTVGNSDTILLNPTDTNASAPFENTWYAAKAQPKVYNTPANFLAVDSRSFGDLSLFIRAKTLRASATWAAVTGSTLIVRIPTADISGTIEFGMTMISPYVPTNHGVINVDSSTTPGTTVIQLGFTENTAIAAAGTVGTTRPAQMVHFAYYNANLEGSGSFTLNGFGKPMQVGFVVIGGINGNMYITSYNRLDDLQQGYKLSYNYDSGKGTDFNYPWIPMNVPKSVAGDSDGYSGEQINAIAISDDVGQWIIAIGSGGTLIWNKLDSPLQVQLGNADTGADTIGKVVMNYGINVFKNFREFDSDNFVLPLSAENVRKYDFTDISWDGEKFIVVGNKSTVIWGYPGYNDEVYIELGNINPNRYAYTRNSSAHWTGGTGLTSLIISIPVTDVIGAPIRGMTLNGAGLPTDSIITNVELIAGSWNITISFASANITTTVLGSFIAEYLFTAEIPVGTVLTFTDIDTATTKTLTVSRTAAKGDSVVYVNGYEKVTANWSISGTGIPLAATVNGIGRFAKFTWKFARGSGRDNNINYESIVVNKTTLQLNKPLSLPNKPSTDTSVAIPAGTSLTFFDATGTKIQKTTTQDVRNNTTTLIFETTDGLKIDYVLSPDTVFGIQSGTKIVSTAQYNIAGVLDHLYRDIPDKIPGASYPGGLVKGQEFLQTNTDPLSLDTIISSEYTDNLLGIRPEDIIVDGGKFIDKYSSHAPEELVPGQVIDSLQMNVFTANVTNGNIDYGNVTAFKIFTDYKLSTVYYRLPDANTTVLTANLSYEDTEISVADIARLPAPAAAINQPGSIWVNGEKINYFGIDLNRGVLTDIRRGAQRTSIPLVHVAGSIITDASPVQQFETDTVLTISNDYSVYNNIGNASIQNTAVYRVATTTHVPQGSIWLDLGQ